MAESGYGNMTDVTIKDTTFTCSDVTIERSKETGWWIVAMRGIAFIDGRFADSECIRITDEATPRVRAWLGGRWEDLHEEDD